jgi:hypothetical protein
VLGGILSTAAMLGGVSAAMPDLEIG